MTNDPHRRIINLQAEVDLLRAENEHLKKKLESQCDITHGLDTLYQRIITEVLECAPISASEREDGTLEPPWEVVARVREDRDKLRAENERLKIINIKSIVKSVMRKMTDCDDLKSGELVLSEEIHKRYLEEVGDA